MIHSFRQNIHTHKKADLLGREIILKMNHIFRAVAAVVSFAISHL